MDYKLREECKMKRGILKLKYFLVGILLFVGILGVTSMRSTAQVIEELYVNGVDIVADSDHTVECGDGVAVYDVESQVLTLTDASLDQGIMVTALDTKAVLQVVVNGENTIVSDVGISVRSNLIISGSGSLDIIAEDYGIYSYADCLIQETDVNVQATVGTAITAWNGVLTIEDSTIVVEGYEIGLEGTNGVYLQGGSITTGATMDTEGRYSNEIVAAVYSIGGEIVIDGVDLQASAIGNVIETDYVSGIQIVDSNVAAIGEKGYGVFASQGTIEIINTTLESSSVMAPANTHGSVYIENSKIVTGDISGELAVYVEASDITAETIYASSGTMELSASSIIAETIEGYPAIKAQDDMSIDDEMQEVNNGSVMLVEDGYITIVNSQGSEMSEVEFIYGDGSSSDGDVDVNVNTDADTDTDVDTDTDIDTEADAETDTDVDIDTDVEDDAESEDDTVPSTGDNSIMWVVIALVSMVLIVACLYSRKRCGILLIAIMVISLPTIKGFASYPIVTYDLAEKSVITNEYVATTESSMHNDVYGTDVTAYAMPLGIYTEVMEGESDAKSLISPPAFFYDTNGNALAPYTQIQDDGSVISGGVAMMDMDCDDELEVLGSYMPETSADGIQISYSFVDSNNYLVGPTVNGHIKMLKTTEDDGEILTEFEVMLDVNIVEVAVAKLSDDAENPNGMDENILSLVYDYEGNLWFTSGGFLMDPTNTDAKQGFYGYLSQEYIAAELAGEADELDVADYIFVDTFNVTTEVTVDGEQVELYSENVENGIASHPEGCIIISNRACYLFEADETSETGITIKWDVPYESDGRKISEDDGTEDGSGAGLAWGSGTSPTATDELVVFADNQTVIELYAVDIYTGEVVLQTPVMDFGWEISVENSLCVYSPNEEQTSILICNWLGAGKNDIVDSSVQTYDALYDNDWRTIGSDYLVAGVQRVDLYKTDDGYEAEVMWSRDDIKSTCMIRFSTGAGYYYGYTQDLQTEEWGFMALDYETGETVLWIPVSDDITYNNMAVGVLQGTSGNVAYCPTNSKTLVSIRDRFVYLPDSARTLLDITEMTREILDDDAIEGQTIVTALMSAIVTQEEAADILNDAQEAVVSFRVNGLTGYVGDYNAYSASGESDDYSFEEITIQLTDETGEVLSDDTPLSADSIYEVRILAYIEDTTEVNVVLTID